MRARERENMSVVTLTRRQHGRIAPLVNLVVQQEQQQQQQPGTSRPSYPQNNVSMLISCASASTSANRRWIVEKRKTMPVFATFPMQITCLHQQHLKSNLQTVPTWKQTFRRIKSFANESIENLKDFETKLQRNESSDSGGRRECIPNDHEQHANSQVSAEFVSFSVSKEDEKERLSVAELQVFLKHMEAAFAEDDPRIGLVALRLGQEHDLHGGSPRQILAYAKKALKILGQQSEDTIEVGMCWHLVGSAYYKMGKHESCLENLSRALGIMSAKEDEGQDCRALKFAVHFVMGDTMAAMGRHDDALENYRVGLSIQESLLDRGRQLAYSCRRVAEAYTQLVQFEEALPLCRKALQMHRQNLGDCSMEEASDRRLLAVIYRGLDDHEKALQEHILVKNILTSKGKTSEDVDMVDLAIADSQISLQHYDEAVEVLESMIPRLEETSPVKGLAHVNLARTFLLQGRMDDAKEECEKGLEIFSNSRREEDANILTIAQGFTELASIFEGMRETEQAIELLEQALSIYQKIPGQLNAVAGAQAQIGMLLYSSRKAAKALPYLEDAASKLKDSFGNDHPALALVLNHMGLANLELKNFSLATELFERCKHIFTASYGAGHADTVAVYHNLVNAYTCLGRLWTKVQQADTEDSRNNFQGVCI